MGVGSSATGVGDEDAMQQVAGEWHQVKQNPSLMLASTGEQFGFAALTSL